MIDKAIAKITKEAMAANDSFITDLEEHLTSICTTNEIAEKILNENKSLKKASEKIWEIARRRKKGNVACIRSNEVFAALEEYYEIAKVEKDYFVDANKTEGPINILDLL